MPTGYTEGLLKGTVKTFPQFAKICMRAFGATIHQRDESLDAPYKPRVPGNFHGKEIAKAKKKLKLVSVYSDMIIVALAKKELTERKNAYIKHTKEAEQNAKRLFAMQSKIAEWTPPTQEHLKFGEFMLQQITSSLQFDGDSKYYRNELFQIEKQIKKIKADVCRKEMIQRAEHDIAYHTRELEEEIKRCKDANKWADELIKSLK